MDHGATGVRAQGKPAGNFPHGAPGGVGAEETAQGSGGLSRDDLAQPLPWSLELFFFEIQTQLTC